MKGQGKTSRDRGTRPTTIINVEWQAGVATILHMRANGVQSKSNGPSYQMPNPLMGDAGSGTGVGGDTGGDTSGDIDAVFRSHANNEVRLSGAMHWCHSHRGPSIYYVIQIWGPSRPLPPYCNIVINWEDPL